MRQVLYGDSKEWLRQQLDSIIKDHIDKTEKATPLEFKQALSKPGMTIREMQFLFVLALLQMQSLRDKLGIADQTLDYARKHMQYYTRGKTGEVESMPALLFVLRVHYLHL